MIKDVFKRLQSTACWFSYRLALCNVFVVGNIVSAKWISEARGLFKYFWRSDIIYQISISAYYFFHLSTLWNIQAENYQGDLGIGIYYTAINFPKKLMAHYFMMQSDHPSKLIKSPLFFFSGSKQFLYILTIMINWCRDENNEILPLWSSWINCEIFGTRKMLALSSIWGLFEALSMEYWE